MVKTKGFLKWAEKIAPLSDEIAGTAFVDFYERHRTGIGDILSTLKDDDASLRGFILRAGLMPPGHSVIDEKIKEFCRLPYRTTDGTIAACPGDLRGLKGCPPHSPGTVETISLLSKAGRFLIVQFEGSEARTQQGSIHSFVAAATKALRENGYDVLEAYASGPCRVCPEGCNEEPECRQPERRLFAPEACGFWVNSLCSAASRFPICGEGPQQVRWIKDWRLATQDTDSVRYVTGFILR
jgi:predicted metal-binding protein